MAMPRYSLSLSRIDIYSKERYAIVKYSLVNINSKKILLHENKEIASDHNYTSALSPEGMYWAWFLTKWNIRHKHINDSMDAS